MKTIVQVSGGKDSTAALIWAIKEFANGDASKILPVFCDTGWEDEKTYKYLDYLESKLNIKIIRLLSKKFTSFLDMAIKKGRFPASKSRFCTVLLKVEPFIDFVLDNIQDDFIVIQGIRADESTNRAKMSAQCVYFKGYRKTAEVKHTYRAKDVKKFIAQYADEVIRPIFHWTTEDVFAYLKKHGFDANPLYAQGFQRVGCYPCIMATKDEVRLMDKISPERIAYIQKIEQEQGFTFFPPNYIPKRYCKNGQYPTIQEVVTYINSKVGLRNKKTKKQTEQLFCSVHCSS